MMRWRYFLQVVLQKGGVPQLLLLLPILLLTSNCRKDCCKEPEEEKPVAFNYRSLTVNGAFAGFDYRGVPVVPEVKIIFGTALDPASVATAVSLTDKNSAVVPLTFSFANNDSTLVIQPSLPLKFISKYLLTVSTTLKSKSGGSLISPVSVNLATAIDSSHKFPVISDDSLLTVIQKRTFRYFWDFGHPVSGMARERSTSGDIVTSGGTGFGIMSIPVAIERKFITRNEGLNRLQLMVSFLKNRAVSFHGAFPHWINGASGAVVPFSEKDNGADIVETSFLMMGLLTARQYFNGSDPAETNLRDDINTLWRNVEWDWFRREGSNRLYWNWSPNYGWAVNVPVSGWNECLITYVLAASSPTHPIPKSVYDEGFARNGAMKNGGTYFGVVLPLGEPYGGPLFFEHYSFLGLNPNGLADAYANYQTQAVNHARINHEYCKANPRNYFGYSDWCWGLTASDIQDGYTASSPVNDVSVIAPTAAVSSIPFTPAESLRAIRFFYYQLGDKIWREYGFVDAFSLHQIWFADSFLAIDQGPQIGMIENYRTGLLWKLFMSCPEVQAGLTRLGFTYQPTN